MVLLLYAIELGAFEYYLGRFENSTKVEAFRFPVINRMVGVQQVHTPNHFIDCANADAGHNLSKFLSHHEHVVH